MSEKGRLWFAFLEIDIYVLGKIDSIVIDKLKVDTAVHPGDSGW